MIERKAYDETTIDRLARYKAGMANPTLDREEIVALSKTNKWRDAAIKDLITIDLIAKIEEVEGDFMDHTQCVWEANDIMHGLPDELIPNINEWIDDKPISDIKINGISALDIMGQFGKRQCITFLQAIECLNAWKKTGYRNRDFCRRYFATL